MSRARFKSIYKSSKKAVLLSGTSFAMLAMSQMAVAQDAPEEIVVTGTRQVIQDAINLKRQATTVVDGLSADEIGELPALSIAEALEQIASVGSQREGSGATEVSIRGLGPFLGSTVINGREATNGSGDRSVNFSQFPSELFNKLEVYKTQEASFIEGGVAGQISLSTLKPLEYGKQRIQFQVKGSVQPQNQNLEEAEIEIGHRITGSYVDQWDGEFGEFGFSIGGQLQRRPNAEQEARTSSTFDACVISRFDGNSCDGGSQEAEDILDARDPNSPRLGDVEPFVLTTSSRSFRQNVTDDSRDSIFAAAQWRPNDRIELNADVQYSDRVFSEFRSDLSVDANDFEDDLVPIPGFELQTTSSGALRRGTTFGEVQVFSEFSERLEEYFGFGGNASFQATDKLRLSVDGSFSDTSRRENQLRARVASGEQLVGIEVLQNGSEAHQLTFVNFDVNDPSLFVNDNPEVRERLSQFRDQEIWAIKGDAEYELGGDHLTAFKAGARYSVHNFDQVPNIQRDAEFDDGADQFAQFVTEIGGVAVEDFGSTANIGPLAAAACQSNAFPESSFLDGEVNGNLITNIDEDGNVIAAGTGNTFLTFDPLCLAETLLGRTLSPPNPEDATPDELVSAVELQEETIALYGQFDFETEFLSLPARGNFGVRYIDTTVTSNAFRTNLVASLDPDTGSVTALNSDGTFVVLEDVSSYSEFLPSFNFNWDLSEDVILRAGVFRAISRHDPSDLGAGRLFSTQGSQADDEDVTIEDLIAGVSSTGNPRLTPFTSWNYDLAAEWYPNPDSILALGVYFKQFNGGIVNVLQEETFNINGTNVTVPVSTQQTIDETNNIFGIEASVAHAFDYLPGLLSGLGFKASYNFAESNFESESARFGDQVELDQNGNIISFTPGFIPPASLQGLSRHTASGQVYYNIGKATVTAIGKYRSDFLQPNNTTPGNLRFIDDAFVLDGRINYKINDNFKISLEGTNLLNTPREHFNPVPDSFAEINVFGPRYFLGITGKF